MPNVKLPTLGEAVETLGSAAGHTVKTAAQASGQVVQDIGSQIGMPTPAAQGTNETQSNTSAQNPTPVRTKDTEEMLKGIYNPTHPQAGLNPLGGHESPDQKTAQEQHGIETARKELNELKEQHKETYYDPTFNRPEPQEERPLEKAEREEQEKMTELREQEKDETPPLAVQRAKNTTERFRGASG